MFALKQTSLIELTNLSSDFQVASRKSSTLIVNALTLFSKFREGPLADQVKQDFSIFVTCVPGRCGKRVVFQRKAGDRASRKTFGRLFRGGERSKPASTLPSPPPPTLFCRSSPFCSGLEGAG